MSGCLDCAEKEKAKNKQLTILIDQAKQKAIEEKKSKAVCEDQINGLFITDAETAIREHFLIRNIVSPL
jgi:hypothetical protein